MPAPPGSTWPTAAVASAYGWPAGLADDAILERLFALNQERAAAGR